MAEISNKCRKNFAYLHTAVQDIKKIAFWTDVSWNNKSITMTINFVDAKKVKIRVGTKYSKSNWKKVTGIIDSK